MNTELLALRDQITEIDNEILELLEDRMHLSEEIALLKKENNLPIEDKKYEATIIESRKMHTSLNEKFVEKLFNLIIQESKKIQLKDEH